MQGHGRNIEPEGEYWEQRYESSVDRETVINEQDARGEAAAVRGGLYTLKDEESKAEEDPAASTVGDVEARWVGVGPVAFGVAPAAVSSDCDVGTFVGAGSLICVGAASELIVVKFLQDKGSKWVQEDTGNQARVERELR